MPDAKDTKATEGADGAIDISKYVSKDEHEKALGTSKTTIDKLQQELEDAKLSLLDPEYISYLESKKGVAKDIKATEKKIEEGGLDKTEIAQLREELRGMRQFQQDIAAVLELQAVEKKYADFADYREGTRTILETSKTPLTIEQAYLLAKASKIEAKTEEQKAADAKSGREKPGTTVPASTLEPKAFKNKADAASDAWDRIVGAGKDTL